MKVSVCLATYNGEKYIYDQLVSILKQINKNDEVIISDDGSTDSTLDIIRSISDDRIKIYNSCSTLKVIDYETRLSRIYLNFKNAILKSSGDVVFLSDQDDIWLDDKYFYVMNQFLDNTVGLVVHDAFTTLSDNSRYNLFLSFFPTKNIYSILKNNPYMGCCMAFRRDIAIRSFANNRIAIPHDTWIALVACHKFKSKYSIKILNDPLIFYRRHDDNCSFFNKSENTFYFKIKYRIKLIYFLFMSK